MTGVPDNVSVLAATLHDRHVTAYSWTLSGNDCVSCLAMASAVIASYWLEERDRAVADLAWEEGYAATYQRRLTNPYREQELDE